MIPRNFRNSFSYVSFCHRAVWYIIVQLQCPWSEMSENGWRDCITQPAVKFDIFILYSACLCKIQQQQLLARHISTVDNGESHGASKAWRQTEVGWDICFACRQPSSCVSAILNLSLLMTFSSYGMLTYGMRTYLLKCIFAAPHFSGYFNNQNW